MNGSTVGLGDSDWPVVFIFSLLFALAIGVANGEVNHAAYLLPGMHLADPDFLASDWYVTQTFHPRRAFAVLVATLARTGRLEMGLGVGTIALSAILSLALYLLSRSLYSQPLVPWLITVVLLAATHTRGVGLNYLVQPQVEASTIAGVAGFCGILALAANWPSLVAGSLFGVAAGLHAHFAVLLVPIVGLVAITHIKSGRFADAAWLLAPVLLLGLPSYAQVLSFSGDPLRESAEQVSLARFPQHYDPRTWGAAQGLALTAVVAAGLAGVALRRPRMSAELTTAIVSLFAIVILSLAVGYSGLSVTILRLFPWRLSIVVIPLAFLFAAAAGSRQTTIPIQISSTLLTLILFACVAVTVAGLLPMRLGIAFAMAVLIVAWSQLNADDGAGIGTRARSRKVAIALALVGILPSVMQGVKSSHFKIRAVEADRAEVYSWVRENTPGEAIFVTPPGWSDFRLVAQRAIVVDHKAPPVQPTELIEWSDRLQAVTGIPPGAEPDELDAAFFAADCDRIRTIQSRYGARFAIRSVESPRCPQAIYEDSLWVVVEPSADAVESAPDE